MVIEEWNNLGNPMMENGVDSKLEVTIDRILVSAQDLRKKLQTIKESGQNFNDSNQMSSCNIRDAQKIKDLQRENVELRKALEDYQYGLEFIMSKYRSQVVELIQLNRIERNNHLDHGPSVNHRCPKDN